MSFGGIKRTGADKAFSDCLREAHDYTCEKCGKNMRHNPRGCHLSHFFTRGNKAVRYDKVNASCLCGGCHDFLGKNSHDHSTWMNLKLGDALYDILVLKAHSVMKERHNAQYIKEAKKHYEEQLQEIRRKRDQGVTGYIDFVSFQ